MRISDWSSDVCSSDLRTGSPLVPAARHQGRGAPCGESFWHWALGADGGHGHAQPPFRSSRLIGAERQPTSDCRQSLQQSRPILQDIHQLRALYERRAGTFLSNAGVLQIFGVNDHDSAKLVSDLLGQETVVFESMSRAIDAEETGISFGSQHVGRPLLTPDEVRTLREGWPTTLDRKSTRLNSSH